MRLGSGGGAAQFDEFFAGLGEDGSEGGAERGVVPEHFRVAGGQVFPGAGVVVGDADLELGQLVEYPCGVVGCRSGDGDGAFEVDVGCVAACLSGSLFAVFDAVEDAFAFGFVDGAKLAHRGQIVASAAL